MRKVTAWFQLVSQDTCFPVHSARRKTAKVDLRAKSYNLLFPVRGYLRLLGGAVSSTVAARRLLKEPDRSLCDTEGVCEGAGLYVRTGGALTAGLDDSRGAGENRLELGADRLKLGSAELGAAVCGANVLGVNDRDGVALGAGALGAAVRGVNVLGVYDGGAGALGAGALGAAVRGVNVLGV